MFKGLKALEYIRSLTTLLQSILRELGLQAPKVEPNFLEFNRSHHLYRAWGLLRRAFFGLSLPAAFMGMEI